MGKPYGDETSIIAAPVFKESQWQNGRIMASTLQNFTRRVVELLSQTRNVAIENRDAALQATAQVTKADANLDALTTTVAGHTATLATHTAGIAQNVSDIESNNKYIFFMGG